MTGAERVIGYCYCHRVLLKRAVGGLLTRFAAKLRWDPCDHLYHQVVTTGLLLFSKL